MSDEKENRRLQRRIWYLRNIEITKIRGKKWFALHPEKRREYNQKFKSENPGYFSLHMRKVRRNTRVKLINVLGAKCKVASCQVNDYPIDLRFIVLQPHHMNGVGKKRNKRNSHLERVEILSGKVEDVQLLCPTHHVIADRLGKDKWLEFLACENNICVQKSLG